MRFIPVWFITFPYSLNLLSSPSVYSLPLFFPLALLSLFFTLLFLSLYSLLSLPPPTKPLILRLSRYPPSLPTPHTFSPSHSFYSPSLIPSLPPSLPHSRMVKQTFSCLGVLIKGLPGAGETSTFDPGGGLTLRDWKMAVEMMKSSMRARDSPTHTLFPGNGGRGWGQWNGR